LSTSIFLAVVLICPAQGLPHGHQPPVPIKTHTTATSCSPCSVPPDPQSADTNQLQQRCGRYSEHQQGSEQMYWAEHEAGAEEVATAVATRANTRSRGTAPLLLNYHTTKMEVRGQISRPGRLIPGERTIDSH
jgi:hypothetical protein